MCLFNALYKGLCIFCARVMPSTYRRPGMIRQETAINDAKDVLSEIFKLIDGNIRNHHRLQTRENELIEAFTRIYNAKFLHELPPVDQDDGVDLAHAFGDAVNEFNLRGNLSNRQIATALIFKVLNVNVFGEISVNFEYCMTYWAGVYVRHTYDKLDALFNILDDVILIFGNAYGLPSSNMLDIMGQFYDRLPDEEPIIKLVIFHAMHTRGFMLTRGNEDEYEFLTELYVTEMKMDIDHSLINRLFIGNMAEELRKRFSNSVQLLYIMYNNTEKLKNTLLNSIAQPQDLVQEQDLIKPVLAIILENCTGGRIRLFRVDMLINAVNTLFRRDNPSQLLGELMLVFRSRLNMSRTERTACISAVLSHLSEVNKNTFARVYTSTAPGHAAQ